MTELGPDLYEELFAKKDQPRHVVGHVLTPDRAGAYATKAITGELNALATAPEGSRNDQLNISGFNLAQLVAGGYADHTEVWDLLTQTGIAVGLSESEVANTLRSAFEAGSRQPRVVSAMDTTPPEVTVLSFDDPPPTEAAPELSPEAALDDLLGRVDWEALWAAENDEEWILYPLVPARRLVAIFSAPKVGKSLLMLELAVQISRGVRVLGNVPAQRRVLYVDFENDPRGDVRTRLQAMGMTPHHLTELVYLSFPRLPFLDTQMGGLQLLGAVEHYGAEVVVIDTVSRAVGGEENSNDTWLGFYKHCGMLLKAAGVACIRLDHSGKDETKGMRGGSAKYGDVDAVWSMTKVEEGTYRLDCTANRLQVGEKTLVIHRETEPNLHHRLDARGEVAAWSATEEAIIATLNEAFGSEPCTAADANEVLQARRGHGMRADGLRKKLLPERNRRNGHYGKEGA